MDNTQRISRRARFEASLRRSGWDEESITYEWFKVESENQAFELYRDNNPDYKGYIKAIAFLHMLTIGGCYEL